MQKKILRLADLHTVYLNYIEAGNSSQEAVEELNLFTDLYDKNPDLFQFVFENLNKFDSFFCKFTDPNGYVEIDKAEFLEKLTERAKSKQTDIANFSKLEMSGDCLQIKFQFDFRSLFFCYQKEQLAKILGKEEEIIEAILTKVCDKLLENLPRRLPSEIENFDFTKLMEDFIGSPDKDLVSTYNHREIQQTSTPIREGCPSIDF